MKKLWLGIFCGFLITGTSQAFLVRNSTDIQVNLSTYYNPPNSGNLGCTPEIVIPPGGKVDLKDSDFRQPNCITKNGTVTINRLHGHIEAGCKDYSGQDISDDISKMYCNILMDKEKLTCLCFNPRSKRASLK